jgi:hypothetical protein
MKMKFKTLALQCKQERVVVDFPLTLSLFYGKMASGKSSIARLIDFCLGGDLERTPALDKELVSAQLSADIGDYEVLFEREGFGSNQIQVTWRDKTGATGSVLAPLSATQVPIWTDKVYNLSDLIFYLSGIDPIKIPKSSKDEETEMVRLSFRDIMWYCYLEQSHLDSSFYWLKTPFKDKKSRYVLNFVVGAYTIRLNELKGELARINKLKTKRIEEAQSLRTFLRQFGYSSEKQIVQEIETIEKNLLESTSDLKKIQEGYLKETHFVDDLREKHRLAEQEFSAQQRSLIELKTKISEQTSLKQELINAKFKFARSKSARNILEGVTFQTCPSCGMNIAQKHTDACSLCGQTQLEEYNTKPRTDDVVRLDLDARIKELEDSIERHSLSLEEQKPLLNNLKTSRDIIDNKLNQALKEQDSSFLAQSRELERQVASFEERIHGLKRIAEMPIAVTALETELETFSAQEERIKREIAQEEETLISREELIKDIEGNYLQSLLAIKLPGVNEDDLIEINRNTWIPYVLPHGKEAGKWDFFNAGSGGKKTLLNVCYALSIHKVAAERNLPLPSFIIIDSPMKNIGKGVNKEIFESFYHYLYNLAQGPLRNMQFILIDTDYIEPPQGVDMTIRLMTPDDPNNPPLIPYYHGP